MDSFPSMLPHQCTVKEPKETRDANKKPSVSYDIVATAVQCRIKPFVEKPVQPVVAGYMLDSTHKCYLKADMVDRIKPKHVVVSANEGVAGTYDVLHVAVCYDAARVHHLTVYLKFKDA